MMLRLLRNPLVVVLLLLALAACGGGQSAAPAGPAGGNSSAGDTSFSSRGDATRGQQVFARCSPCHATTDEILVGPGMAGLFSASGPKLPDGVDYGGKLPNGQERTETNIAAWINEGGAFEIGLMPPQALTDQELADVIAYLRTLEP